MHFLSEVREGLAISFRGIRANKMRSVLTTLSIVIGIMMVTLMATVIEGLNRGFAKSAAAFGTDVLYVQKFPWVSNDDWATIRNRRNLEVSYAEQIDRKATMAAAVSPSVGTVRHVSFGNNSMDDAFISGTTDQYLMTAGAALADGRFFTAQESQGGRPVCAIGADVAENLFPHQDPIGSRIEVAGYPYMILGVFEKQGGLFGQFTTDRRVFIPLNSFTARFGGRRDVTIQVRVADIKQMEDARLEIEGIMRSIRGLAPGKANDFNVNQQELLTEAFAPISAVMAVVGLFITGLSLFVGGIGIMNIMYVSVSERTREIGIRKAIGAKRRTILLQFLVESALLCIMGGLIGLGLAYPLSLVVDQFVPTAMPFSVVFLSIGISLVVGVVSGFLPAFRASKMDPVEALRYE
jgi:putative ABC transport system permease protein